jgi:hypothetical protein
MASPGDLDALSPTELKALVLELLGKVAALEQTVAAQRAEIARLKALNPDFPDGSACMLLGTPDLVALSASYASR